MTPERSRLRARALQLFDELESERGWSDYEMSERLGLDRTWVYKTRRDPRRAVGADAAAKICSTLRISPAFWSSSGSYRLFEEHAPREDDREWSAFVSRHRASLDQIGEEAAGWVRTAPFRGGMSDPALGWALALDTAARLRQLSVDPQQPTSERVVARGAKMMGPRTR
jgi:transcriptional regulator with XRE-family HTH domain